MSPTLVKPRTQTKPKTQRPPLWKVILLNDDFTPREFVVVVLKAVFRMNESQAYKVMMTAHQKGACQGSDRIGQGQRLSAVFHDRKGRIDRVRIV
jgi:ATP-dependent Clp protease adapter protein ClpS